MCKKPRDRIDMRSLDEIIAQARAAEKKRMDAGGSPKKHSVDHDAIQRAIEKALSRHPQRRTTVRLIQEILPMAIHGHQVL